MRIVNLASRPFLNRRPVRRISIFLWVVGALLCAVTVWLYAEYFRGTTLNRARLAELGAEIEAADEAAEVVTRRLQRLDLAERNSRIHFLNDVIEKRTFPWSRLFDDLEDVLLDEIYLRSVSPSVEDEDESASGGVRRRVVTPAEARERARRERRERRGEAADEAEDETATVETPPAEPKLVNLSLVGFARTDEALLDFVDALYAAESFLEPYLSSERRESGGREVSFQITVRYLLPANPPPPPVQQLASTRAAADQETTTRDDEDAGGPPRVVVEPSDEPAGESAARSGSRPEPQDGESEVTSGAPGGSAVSVSERPRGGRATATPQAAEETGRDRRPPRRATSGTATGGRPAATEPTDGPAVERSTSEPAPDLAEPAASAARSVGERSRRRPER